MGTLFPDSVLVKPNKYPMSLLDDYKQLPFFGDKPLYEPIQEMCRLSNDEDISAIISESESRTVVLYTVRPAKGFYVIEKVIIDIQNINNKKQIPRE